MSRVTLAYPGSCYFRVVVIPRVCRLSPVMTQCVDIFERLYLDSKRLVFKRCTGIGSLTFCFACGSFCDLDSRFHGFCFLVGRVVAAGPGRCYLRVVIVPGINRFTPCVADRVDLRLFRLGNERLVLIRRAGKCPFSLPFAGGCNRHCGCYSCFFCLLMCCIAFANPGRCHFRIVVIPRVCRLSPVMAQCVNILQRLRLHSERLVFKRRAGIAGLAL